MLNEYWIELKAKNRTGNRTLDGIRRIAKAQARLRLKDTVDVEIAKEVIRDYNTILEDYGKAIGDMQDPRLVTYNLCLSELKDAKYPVTFEELAKVACEKDELVMRYIIGGTKIDRNGTTKLKLRNNHKLRNVLDMVLNHSSVRQVQQKPLIIQWIEPEGSEKLQS